ncbi:MAG: FAD-binding oxidoreductase [Paracoccaceae bacterium]
MKKKSLHDAGPAFLSDLKAALGPGAVIPPEARHLEEPRGIFKGRAAAVLRPKSTADVAAIVGKCAQARVGVVPISGGTGLVGGQTLEDGALPVLLSLERMCAIREVDTFGNTLVAEAGAILADVRSAAEKAGRQFPLSLASEGSCRIGGNLSTNAGGVQVLRYGSARSLCLGIEAVLPDGSVLHGLSRLYKDNTGYDIRDLLIGAEGTLGVITAAALRLFDIPGKVVTAFLSVSSPRTALAVFDAVRHELGPSLTAFELLHRNGLEFLEETGLSRSRPFGRIPQWCLLLEAGGGGGQNLAEQVETVLAGQVAQDRVEDVLIAQNEAQRAAFWNIRETIPLANRQIGAISSHDISLPIDRIPEFIEAADAAIFSIRSDLRTNCFGHIGDGNLHYNVFPPKGTGKEALASLRPVIKDGIHDLCDKLGGSFSAEHGVGRLKLAELEKYGDPAKLAVMRAIKSALDPQGIMNPGAVLR